MPVHKRTRHPHIFTYSHTLIPKHCTHTHYTHQVRHELKPLVLWGDPQQVVALSSHNVEPVCDLCWQFELPERPQQACKPPLKLQGSCGGSRSSQTPLTRSSARANRRQTRAHASHSQNYACICISFSSVLAYGGQHKITPSHTHTHTHQVHRIHRHSHTCARQCTVHSQYVHTLDTITVHVHFVHSACTHTHTHTTP